MKIYQLSVMTHMMRHYFFATKGEAEAEARNQRNDPDGEKVHDTEIYVLEFTPNRAGAVKLLNDFVSQTCMNEG